MEEFLPSEVARAVYGYLLREGCEEAAKKFLETSPNLTECKQRVNQGKRLTHANTLLLGKSLTDVLNITCNVHSLLRQAYEKQQHNRSGDDREVWSGLLEDLRSFVLAEGTTNLSGAQPSSVDNTDQQSAFAKEDSVATPQSVPQNREPSPQQLNTPKKSPCLRRNSFADSYQSLVRECSVVFDESLLLDKSQNKSQDNDILSRPLDRPTSAPGALVIPELENENQSAITAITGMTFGQPQHSPIPKANDTTLPAVTSCNSSQQRPPAVSSAPILVPVNFSAANTPQLSACDRSQSINNTNHSINVLPPSTSASHMNTVNSICGLPDPPILVLNSQNEPVMNSTYSPSYLNMSPSATSTPHSTAMFNPQDTACIIYPPLVTDKPKTKKKVKKCTTSKLRTLLPKPHRKDPPDIIHVHVLPQVVEEEEEEVDENYQETDNQEYSDTELAVTLPKLCEEVRENMDANEDVAHKEKEQVEDTNCSSEENIKGNDNDENNIAVEETNCSSEENIKGNDNDENNTAVEETNCSSEEHIKGNDNDENNIAVKELEDKNPTERPTEAQSNKNSNTKETNTPKPNVLRKNISRSTPRRNSHIRALSFNTPNKPIETRKFNTSPKTPRIQFSPRSSKLNNIKRSSLFKSPPINSKKLPCLTEEENKDEQSEEIENVGPFIEELSLSKVPIATISPAQKLSNAWREVNDIIITPKPQWDEKIRSFVSGDFIDPAPPPKKESKTKSKANNKIPKKESTKKKMNKDLPTRRSSRLKKRRDSQSSSPDIKETKESEVKTPKKQKTPEKVVENESNTNLETIECNTKVQFKKLHKAKNIKHFPGKITLNEEINSSSNENTSNITLNNYKISDSNLTNKSVSKPLNEEDINLSSMSPVNSKKENSREEKGNMNCNNILLDDLGLSSNSSFPQTANEITPATKTQASESVQEEAISTHDNSEVIKLVNRQPQEDASKFALPSIPVMATPLKEYQLIAPQTPALNTPLLKVIRQETSVLEEDLLLTPSLPPTPLVRSPKQLAVTPCKPNTSSSVAVEKTVSSNNAVSVSIENNEPLQKIHSSCTYDKMNKVKENETELSERSHFKIKESPQNSNNNLLIKENPPSKHSSCSSNSDVLEDEENKSPTVENIEIKYKKDPLSIIAVKDKLVSKKSRNYKDIKIIKINEAIIVDEKSSCSDDNAVIEVQEKEVPSGIHTHTDYKKDLKSNAHIRETIGNNHFRKTRDEKINKIKGTKMPSNKTLSKEKMRSSKTLSKDKTKINSLIKEKVENEFSSCSDSSDVDSNINHSKSKSCHISPFEPYNYVDALYSSTESSEEEMEHSPNELLVSPVKTTPKVRVRVVQGQSPGTKSSNKMHIHKPSESRNVQPVINGCNNVIEPKKNLSNLATLILENERRMLDRQSSKISKKNSKKSRKKKKESERKNSKTGLNEDGIANKSEKYKLNTKDNVVKPVTPEQIRQELQVDLIKRERQQIFGDSLPSSTDSESDIEIFEEKKYPSEKRKTVPKIRKNIVKPVTSLDKYSLDVVSIKKDKHGKVDEKVTFQTNKECTNVTDKSHNNVKSINADESSDNLKENNCAITFSSYSPIKNHSKFASKVTQEEHEGSTKSNKSSVGGNNAISETIKIGVIKTGCFDNLSHDLKLTVPSVDADSFADVSSSMDANNPVQNKIEDGNTGSSSGINYNRIDTDIPRPPTPFRVSSSEQTTEIIDSCPFLGESSDEPENHVVVISTTTDRTNNSLCVSELNPDYKLGYEVDENKISTISFSKPIVHLSLPTGSKISKFMNKTQGPETNIPETSGGSKVQIRKKRITLTPVGDDKYEQKLKVDYDVIDGKVISKRGDRRLSVDMDILDCTCSTIVDGEVSSSGEVTFRKEQNFTLIASPKETTNLFGNSKENIKSVKNTVEGSTLQKEKYTNDSEKELSMRSHLNVKHVKGSIKDLKDILREDNKSKPDKSVRNIEKSNTSQHKSDRSRTVLKDSASSEKYKEKSRNHHFEKRKTNGDKEESYRSQCKHSPQKHFRDRYHPRYSDNRRMGINRRYYRSPSVDYFKKRTFPHSSDRKHNFIKYQTKKSSTEVYGAKERSTKASEARKVSFNEKLKVHYEDLDNVVKKEKMLNTSIRPNKKASVFHQETLDPRVSNLVAYSDNEKNESCDTNSLMDFAILSKPKDSRLSEVPNQSSCIKGSKTSSQSHTSQDLKRKSSMSDEDNLEYKNESKRLKLDEVDMKEAKSVLKHKMTDMLNALHPDTSNQDS